MVMRRYSAFAGHCTKVGVRHGVWVCQISAEWSEFEISTFQVSFSQEQPSKSFLPQWKVSFLNGTLKFYLIDGNDDRFALPILCFFLYRNHKTVDDNMAPFQTAVTLSDDMRDGQEVIEVQILPQVSTFATIPFFLNLHEWTVYILLLCVLYCRMITGVKIPLLSLVTPLSSQDLMKI